MIAAVLLILAILIIGAIALWAHIRALATLGRRDHYAAPFGGSPRIRRIGLAPGAASGNFYFAAARDTGFAEIEFHPPPGERHRPAFSYFHNDGGVA